MFKILHSEHYGSNPVLPVPLVNASNSARKEAQIAVKKSQAMYPQLWSNQICCNVCRRALVHPCLTFLPRFNNHYTVVFLEHEISLPPRAPQWEFTGGKAPAQTVHLVEDRHLQGGPHFFPSTSNQLTLTQNT